MLMAHEKYKDFYFWYVRRKYHGKTTFTWVYMSEKDENDIPVEKGCGDPFQKIVLSKKDKDTLIQNYQRNLV